ncbi:hypothetical protein BGZ75_000291 [Mortierella antarctica]|nr:hypothetical protein BGZ75_000291 [Mortierella antarctica]
MTVKMEENKDQHKHRLEHKETSARKIKALVAISKKLVQEPVTAQSPPIDVAAVQAACFRPTDFQQHEYQAVADLVNILRPYVPKRRVDPQTNRSKASLPHIALRAPFVLIANTILQAAGYSEFTRRMVPKSAPSSLHAIALGGTGMYEVFCAETPGHFDVKGADRAALRNYKNVTVVPVNKPAMFEQFFDMQKIDDACQLMDFSSK